MKRLISRRSCPLRFMDKGPAPVEVRGGLVDPNDWSYRGTFHEHPPFFYTGYGFTHLGKKMYPQKTGCCLWLSWKKNSFFNQPGKPSALFVRQIVAGFRGFQLPQKIGHLAFQESLLKVRWRFLLGLPDLLFFGHRCGGKVPVAWSRRQKAFSVDVLERVFFKQKIIYLVGFNPYLALPGWFQPIYLVGFQPMYLVGFQPVGKNMLVKLDHFPQ